MKGEYEPAIMILLTGNVNAAIVVFIMFTTHVKIVEQEENVGAIQYVL
jgi:hypothetical protein